MKLIHSHFSLPASTHMSTNYYEEYDENFSYDSNQRNQEVSSSSLSPCSSKAQLTLLSDDCYSLKFLESNNQIERSVITAPLNPSSHGASPSQATDDFDVDSQLQLPDYLCDLHEDDYEDNQTVNTNSSLLHNGTKMNYNDNQNKPIPKNAKTNSISQSPINQQPNNAPWIQSIQMKSSLASLIEVSYNSLEQIDLVSSSSSSSIQEDSSQNHLHTQFASTQNNPASIESETQKEQQQQPENKIVEEEAILNNDIDSAEKIAMEKNMILEAFCEQVHLQNSMGIESENCSVFPVSNYYSISAQSNNNRNRTRLVKSYYSIPFVEFLENQSCTNSSSSSSTRPPKHNISIPLHSMINHFKFLIEDSPNRTRSSESEEFSSSLSNAAIVSAILSDCSQFTLGQIVSQSHVELATADGLKVSALCIWQVFPVASDNLIEGILLKQTWIIENATEITQARMKVRGSQSKRGKNSSQFQQLSLQEQADELDSNNLAHSPFTSAVVVFLRAFEYINKQKRIKKIDRLQDKYPHKTCKYRFIPKSSQQPKSPLHHIDINSAIQDL